MWCGLLPRTDIDTRRCDVCLAPLNEEQAEREAAERQVFLTLPRQGR